MEGTSDVDVLALLLRAARTWPTQLEALCGYELSSGRIGAALRSGILGLEKEGAKMTQTVHDELRA